MEEIRSRVPIVEAKKDPSKVMKALQWEGKEKVSIAFSNAPMVTEPEDAIIRISSTTICGSDLHLYHHEFSGLEKGDILGHEFMGVVDDIGTEVKGFKKGDRVVVSAIISCGECFYCKKQLFSCCDCTNPSKEMESLYGHRCAGIFGYSHLTGGWAGGQAEFCRVPFADVNLLKVPDNMEDEQVLFLSDIVCTAWHANELAQVEEGQVVAVWGLGPVGLLALQWAKFRGAKRIIGIDGVPSRLKLASEHLGADVIDFTKEEVVSRMQELVPGGPDACIDAVGFRFPKGLLHKFQRAMRLETDTPEVLTEAIKCVRKCGKIGIVGDYYAFANNFPIGAFMEKGLSMSGGQVFVQKYWKKLLQHIADGKFDARWLITHTMPLDEAATAYRMFDQKEDGAVKIILKTGAPQAT